MNRSWQWSSNLDVLGSGCDVTIGAELEALHTKDVMLYTDSGISEELWLRFSIMEMVKVYFDMKKLVIDLCKIAIEIAESNAKDSLNGVSAHAVQRFSRKTYEAISDVITYGDPRACAAAGAHADAALSRSNRSRSIHISKNITNFSRFNFFFFDQNGLTYPEIGISAFLRGFE